MASSGGLATEVPSQEVFQWLKNLPVAPEYHPTPAEFQDPIAYIFKIEKEASKYGICKIVPPVLASPKKTAIANLSRSLAARSGEKSPPTFTTRQQQIGFCPRRPRPVRRPVWQSGECYTFQEFEAKAKAFEKFYLKKYSKKVLSPLEIETLYWKATVDKPFSVEYANDMAGSAFSMNKSKEGGSMEGLTVGETEWNMRSVSRARGSLLRFMKEEIPGVTSPMLYIAMMFSWFAWHVEDHDLHSLNYLHMGAGKTWYGVPKEAAVAFEEVVRVHGYGEEINPLVTFAVLGEKTTIISPEVFINAGVPCCRLVQNAGEFVVTFPRAYHSGFSHGFNCAEAANIATPKWLRVAKEAAIRRASINYPPMVSHFQLLYDLALEFCTRIPVCINLKPRSSRLKDKQKGGGETLVKEQFVKNVIQNNDLLHILGKGCSVVLLPQSSSDVSVCSTLRVGSQLRLNPSFGLYSHKQFVKSAKSSISDEILWDGEHGMDRVNELFSLKGKFAASCERNYFSPSNGRGDSETHTTSGDSERSGIHSDKLSDQRLFSCVTCGILSFDCVAIIRPREAAAKYLMSADCSFFNDWIVGSGITSDGLAVASDNANASEQKSSTRSVEKHITNGLYDAPVRCTNYQVQMTNQSIGAPFDSGTQKEASALGLLALNYANSSDSEDGQTEINVSNDDDEVNTMPCSLESKFQGQNSAMTSFKQDFVEGVSGRVPLSHSRLDYEDEITLQIHDCHAGHKLTKLKDRNNQTRECSAEFETGNLVCTETNGFECKLKDPMPHKLENSSPVVSYSEKTKVSQPIIPKEQVDASFGHRSDEDSSRMHVFCLEHAVEVEQQLRPIGGVHIMLLCHPEYPKIEAEAKLVAEELGFDCLWNEIRFAAATKDDIDRIRSALDSEDAIPRNGDWAVKLGINLFYSANLGRSPLYSKQMPYNSVIYNAFGRTSPATSPTKSNINGRRPRKQKKVVAGKWCGKVWMSNQVHPFLAKWDCEAQDQEQEQERNFHGWNIPDEKLDRKPRSTNRKETSSVIRKYARKRKVKTESRSIKKGKYMETEAAVSDDSMEDNPDKKHSSVHSWNDSKYMNKEVSYDSLENNSHQLIGRLCRSKQGKSVDRNYTVSDDSLGDNSHQQYGKTLRSNQAKPIESKKAVSRGLTEKNSQKQHRKIVRSNEGNCVKAGAILDDSLEDYNSQWEERSPRNTRTDPYETEDALTDDSLEESSHRLHVRASRSKQAKYMVREAAISDDSAENRPRWKNKRIYKGDQAKYMDRDVLDDTPEERAYQKLMRFSKNEHPKFIEMEYETSDDSLGDSIHQQNRRIQNNKLAKFIERERYISDDSAEDTIQSYRRAARSKKSKFIAREDAVSDDLLVGDTRQQYRRAPRNKKAKFIEREEAVPDDLHEDNNQRQLRKTHRGKQMTLIVRDNAASDDLLEENSEQSMRILRNKQNKQLTLRQMKQETSRQMKQGTHKLTKKNTPQSIKQERQVKQGTPHLRSTRNEKYSQIDNRVEEVEGGPSTRLRQRPSKSTKQSQSSLKGKLQIMKKNLKNASAVKTPSRKNAKGKDEEEEYECDIEGCTMSFGSKQELAVHKRNLCPVKGCGKKFFSHKYLVQHRRVHLDDRPLKCPWKGCKMTFKWAWARTEHVRVHTGARPYVCAEEGCGQTFRFVSDFSRHKRKTGHSVKKARG